MGSQTSRRGPRPVESRLHLKDIVLLLPTPRPALPISAVGSLRKSCQRRQSLPAELVPPLLHPPLLHRQCNTACRVLLRKQCKCSTAPRTLRRDPARPRPPLPRSR